MSIKIQRDFVKYETERARKLGVSVVFHQSPQIDMNGCMVTGYFDDYDKVIAIAKKRPFHDWLQVFIHEGCHMDQWSEGSRYWNIDLKGKVGKHDSLTVFDMHVDGVINLSETNKNEMLRHIVGVEWDCEKRTVKKIKEYDLGIDIATYTKIANSYCYLYPYNASKKHWMPLYRAIRANKGILDVMPEKFLKTPSDYVNIPTKIRNQFDIAFEKTNKRKNIV